MENTSITPVTDEEALSRLWMIRERAISENNTDEMRSLVLIYRGLGYECNAAALERRLDDDILVLQELYNP